MEHVLERPVKKIFQNWKALEFGLASPGKSWKKHFNVCTNPVNISGSKKTKHNTEIGLCKLFTKNTVDELATVHECIRVTTTSYI